MKIITKLSIVAVLGLFLVVVEVEVVLLLLEKSIMQDLWMLQ